jgi:hypothetical protein
MEEYINSENRDSISLSNLAKTEYNSGYVYPYLAAGATITSAAGSFVLGAASDIIPNSAITSDYKIFLIYIEDIDTVDKTYILNLYRKDNDLLLGSVRNKINTFETQIPNIEFPSPKIPANVGVYGKIAVEDGLSKTMVVAVGYILF